MKSLVTALLLITSLNIYAEKNKAYEKKELGSTLKNLFYDACLPIGDKVGQVTREHHDYAKMTVETLTHESLEKSCPFLTDRSKPIYLQFPMIHRTNSISKRSPTSSDREDFSSMKGYIKLPSDSSF
jgi:hypothetical protein